MLHKIKVSIKLLLRFKTDLVEKNIFRFARKNNGNIDFKHTINISQEIKKSETFENKVFNLALASERISEYVIMPGEIFSFWKIVGNPNYQFKKGRTLINGKVGSENGGGLCQVSGIVYLASIVAGLEILERYNHSVDIYTDETRFAPLGVDATVVYGYKDLRVRNSFLFPIKFDVKVAENQININLRSTQKMKENTLVFESEHTDNAVIVSVMDDHKNLINRSMYRGMPLVHS